jgi:hypothetical protein
MKSLVLSITSPRRKKLWGAALEFAFPSAAPQLCFGFAARSFGESYPLFWPAV